LLSKRKPMRAVRNSRGSDPLVLVGNLPEQRFVAHARWYASEVGVSRIVLNPGFKILRKSQK
jgi:hypothetical protein